MSYRGPKSCFYKEHENIRDKSELTHEEVMKLLEQGVEQAREIEELLNRLKHPSFSAYSTRLR